MSVTLLAAENQTSAEAQYEIGCNRYHGLHKWTIDAVVAREQFEKAAKEGHAGAKYMLEVFSEAKNFKDVEEIAALLKGRLKRLIDTEENQPAVLYHLGICYHYGQGGVTQDRKYAAELFRLAANQGYAQAEYWYGWCISEANPIEALALYRRAMIKGLVEVGVHLKKLSDSNPACQEVEDLNQLAANQERRLRLELKVANDALEAGKAREEARRKKQEEDEVAAKKLAQEAERKAAEEARKKTQEDETAEKKAMEDKTQKDKAVGLVVSTPVTVSTDLSTSTIALQSAGADGGVYRVVAASPAPMVFSPAAAAAAATAIAGTPPGGTSPVGAGALATTSANVVVEAAPQTKKPSKFSGCCSVM